MHTAKVPTINTSRPGSNYLPSYVYDSESPLRVVAYFFWMMFVTSVTLIASAVVGEYL